MKIKEFNWLLILVLRPSIIGITLWPFGIYFRYINKVSKKIKNHETIHLLQQKELVGVFFYILYILEWFIKLFVYGSKSYNNISFEREAYINQSNLKYIETRKQYSWLKYIFNDK